MRCSYLTPMSTSPSKFSIANTNTENRSELILCANVCVAIDAMLNFGGDINAVIKCEQAAYWCPLSACFDSNVSSQKSQSNGLSPRCSCM